MIFPPLSFLIFDFLQTGFTSWYLNSGEHTVQV